MNLTPDILQSMTIKVVTQYMTKQAASLSDAVAAEARLQEMNADQTKRLIEASNSVCYLRKLASAEDKTEEFPVASYEEVLEKMATTPTIQAPSDTVQVQEKQAAAAQHSFELEEREKIAMVAKEVVRCRGSLEKIAMDKISLHDELLTAASSVKKDPLALEKIAHVATPESYEQLLKLAGVQDDHKTRPAALFREGDLNGVTKLAGLLKKAEALVEEEKRLQDLEKRAFSIIEPFAKGVAGLARKAVTGTAGWIQSAAKNSSGISNAIKEGKKTNPNFGRSDAIKNFKADAATMGHTAAVGKHGFTPTMLNSMNGATKLTLATAPMMSVPGASVWDKLHGTTGSGQ